MNFEFIPTVLDDFSILGTVVFAISGALFAAERRLDILGFVLMGTATGIGGGTLRDLLLGVSPVNWIVHPLGLYLAMFASVLTYFTVNLYRRRQGYH